MTDLRQPVAASRRQPVNTPHHDLEVARCTVCGRAISMLTTEGHWLHNYPDDSHDATPKAQSIHDLLDP